MAFALKSPKWEKMASGKQRNPLKSVKGNNVLILNSLNAYFSDSVPRSLPIPTSLPSLFSVEIIQSEMCHLKLTGFHTG